MTNDRKLVSLLGCITVTIVSFAVALCACSAADWLLGLDRRIGYDDRGRPFLAEEGEPVQTYPPITKYITVPRTIDSLPLPAESLPPRSQQPIRPIERSGLPAVWH